MRRLRELIVRFGGLFNKQRRDRELDDEIESHVQMHIEDKLRLGMTPEEARRQALIKLGGIEATKEAYRDQRSLPILETLWQNVRYGVRMLRKNPGFTVVAVLTLALGIGANTAIFSAVDAVLIRPLPYADAGRLVMIWDELSHEGISKHFPAPAEWLEWRRHNTVFTDIAATQPGAATLSGDSEPEPIPARKTTANLWGVRGVKPLIGRVFTEEEEEKGVWVVVISYGLWQRRYGGSSDVLGRKITVNDNPYEVIGVMPREFYFLPARDIDIWMPRSRMRNSWAKPSLRSVGKSSSPPSSDSIVTAASRAA